MMDIHAQPFNFDNTADLSDVLTEAHARYRLSFAGAVTDNMSADQLRIALWAILMDNLAGRPADLFGCIGNALKVAE